MTELPLLAQDEAPGKVILMGEHAVVYGQPALAMPVFGVQARARVWPYPKGRAGQVWLEAPQVDLVPTPHEALPRGHPLRVAVEQVLERAGKPERPLLVRVTSTIPVAAGLGSSAAVTVALVRALARALGHALPPEVVNAMAYEVEKIHHGTPSGIDNTVVTYARPVYFRKGHPPRPLQVQGRFVLVVGDTGVPASTRETVGRVRRGWQQDRATYEALFEAIGRLVEQAREALARGDARTLGNLMDENHRLLQALGVSHPALERLVEAARAAGALGAKLSGGGGGGNMIALVPPQAVETVRKALYVAGAPRTWVTEVAGPA